MPFLWFDALLMFRSVESGLGNRIQTPLARNASHVRQVAPRFPFQVDHGRQARDGRVLKRPPRLKNRARQWHHGSRGRSFHGRLARPGDRPGDPATATATADQIESDRLATAREADQALATATADPAAEAQCEADRLATAERIATARHAEETAAKLESETALAPSAALAPVICANERIVDGRWDFVAVAPPRATCSRPIRRPPLHRPGPDGQRHETRHAQCGDRGARPAFGSPRG